MFRRILLASDDSIHSQRSARAALDLVMEINGASIIIMYVMPSVPSRNHLMERNFNMKQILDTELKKKVPTTLKLFEEAEVDFRIQAAVGDPSEEIVAFAKEEEMDLIVIGSRGLNTLGEVLLGSVSHKVAHDAHCPVMIVK